MSKKTKPEIRAEAAEPKAEIPEAAQSPKPESVLRYTLEKFSKYSIELLGIDKCTFAGVTHGLSGEFTVEEMKEIVRKWKSAKVKNKETEV